MVPDMFEAVAVLGVVEALVFDFPAALGPEEEGAAAHPVAREVGEPIGLVHRAVGLVLAVKTTRTVGQRNVSQGSKSSASQISTRSLP